ncbi:MAG: gephyrin-like molybdotransferase Glp [Candidatus Margulisiibacteriota bacterium]
MIKATKALNIILGQVRSLGTGIIPLSAALGRFLGENVYSDVNVPPFDRSAMDGFAVNSKDQSKEFMVIENIPAGKVPQRIIRPGECARIMTGAMLPRGADQVIRVENTFELSKGKVNIIRTEKRRNVAKCGEDVKRGELVLSSGSLIRPQEVAMLATVGKTRVKVISSPKVGVISTGSELVEPNLKPMTGQIRNSNGPMLISQLKRLGIEADYLGIAKDDIRATKSMVTRGLRENDILILSGGVSVGDYDFVKEVLRSCGVKIVFNKVAIKPGKPTVFGTKGKKLIFGLPGNPVSVLVVFELFVAPAINKMIGKEHSDTICSLPLITSYSCKYSKREQYLPVLIKRGGVQPVDFHGSAHMFSLTKANGVIRIKSGDTNLKKGRLVDVRPI